MARPAYTSVHLSECLSTDECLTALHAADSDTFGPACPLQEFFSKPCWSHHPKPYADFMSFKQEEEAKVEAERKKMIRV